MKGEGRQGNVTRLHGFVSLCNAGCQTTVAAPLCFVAVQVNGLTCSSYCPLLQECSLNLFAPPGSSECQPQPDSSFLWVETCSELLAAGLCPWLLLALLANLVHSYLPTFRCFNECISQTCLFIEQGVLC